MKDKLRVAAYCRVSTDKDDQINSLNSQRQYFTDYIKNRKDWTLVNIYYEACDIIEPTQKNLIETGFSRVGHFFRKHQITRRGEFACRKNANVKVQRKLHLRKRRTFHGKGFGNL